MKSVQFPITPTRKATDTSDNVYDVNSPDDRKRYFTNKVGKEISDLREHFRDNTFICYLLGKKMAGKSTYTKLLAEIFGQDKIRHISIGDVVRSLEAVKNDEVAKAELFDYLEKNYRGYISIEDAFDAFLGRSAAKALPTEFILAILKREIEKYPKTNLFIDGFPRTMDQISYSLYFRELINYRDDPDIFAMIDIPEAVIEARIKERVVCPLCASSRNIALLPTSRVIWDKEKSEFYLECDNPECKPVKMVRKEGDELGIETIRDRLEADEKLIALAANLHGIPKIYLRNAVPVEAVGVDIDEYEVTKNYEFKLKDDGSIEKIEHNWEFDDDNGVRSNSLLAAPVVVAFIKQLHKHLIK